MPLELVTESPKKEDFTPLSEHQSQTPATFFGAKPVLHHQSPNAKLAVRKSEYEQNEILRQIQAASDSETEDAVLDIDVWVTSKNVILFSTTSSKGVAIDYPIIVLHALGSQDGQATVYLQLDLHDQELTNDDEDIQTLSLHIIPQVTSEEEAGTNGHSEGAEPADGTSPANNAAAKALFEALSACADLNPDPMDEDEDGDGGPQIPEPGAGGWITSENMHEFMDENGNWTGPEIPVLGAGAGQVRSRGDEEEEEAEGEDTKWQRTG